MIDIVDLLRRSPHTAAMLDSVVTTSRGGVYRKNTFYTSNIPECRQSSTTFKLNFRITMIRIVNACALNTKGRVKNS